MAHISFIWIEQACQGGLAMQHMLKSMRESEIEEVLTAGTSMILTVCFLGVDVNRPSALRPYEAERSICPCRYLITSPAAREWPIADICAGESMAYEGQSYAGERLTCMTSTGTPPHSFTFGSPIATSSPVLNHLFIWC